MTQDNINLLTLHTFYLIMSNITKKPYIDKSFACYMFELKADAVAFTKEIPNTFFDAAKNYKQATFCTEFYSYGITHIKAKEPRNAEYTDIPVEKADAKRHFYNPCANRLIYRLRQTNQTQYLRGFKDLCFYAPILIDLRLPRQHPLLHYSCAKSSAIDKFYLLFSTLQEFDAWNAGQESNWSPLEFNLSSFKSICGNDPIMINPMSDKLLLNHRLLKIAIGG